MTREQQERVAMPIGLQEEYIKASLGECKVAFAKRIGRSIGSQIKRGVVDPKLDVRLHFQALATSEARLLTLYQMHGVTEDNLRVALAATYRKVIGGQS